MPEPERSTEAFMKAQESLILLEKLLLKESASGYRSSDFYQKVVKLLKPLTTLPQYPAFREEVIAIVDLAKKYSASSPIRRSLFLGEIFKKLKNLKSRLTEKNPHLLLEEITDPVRYIKGVGEKLAKFLEARLKIKTASDLLMYFPRDYRDRSHITTLAHLKPFEKSTFRALITSKQKIPVKRSSRFRHFWKFTLEDPDTGTTAELLIFGRDYMAANFKKGDYVVVEDARAEMQRGKLVIKSFRDMVPLGSLKNPIVPIYSLPVQGSPVKGLQKKFHSIMDEAIKKYVPLIADPLPEKMRKGLNLPLINHALAWIHFPPSMKKAKISRTRMGFQELFLLELYLEGIHEAVKKKVKSRKYTRTELAEKFLKMLPFELTNAQKRVIEEVKRDLLSPSPMNRLLQGDVGSGKTIIAAYASILVAENGYQVAFMAPTEVLAEQHYLNLKPYFDSVGIKSALLIGSLPLSRKKAIHMSAQVGDIKVIIGTHALIQEAVKFKSLGLAIVDEQHRFGVEQRDLLYRKGEAIDVLVMTATPIPRTLALTVYGDLDVSILDELPPGRKPIKTVWLPKNQRKKAYAFLKSRVVNHGEQGYIVFPLIEESEKVKASAAVKAYQFLKEKVFRGIPIGLLHGQMKQEEKSAVMRAFKEGKIKVLVATPVIEVGVDSPSATVMIIEDAQRFGLAQLHQLRGRVGRSEKKSYCFLITPSVYNPYRKQTGKDEDAPLFSASSSNENTSREEKEFTSVEEALKKALNSREENPERINETIRRLRVIVSTNDGFKIAEEDLKIRGMGQITGTRQHGLPEFSVPEVLANAKIVELARQKAREILKEDPKLEKYPLLKKALELYKQKYRLISVG